MRLNECAVWVESSFLGVASGSLLMILANFSSRSPGRGFAVGMFILEPAGGPLFPLLITAKASETRSSAGGWKERSSSSESSRQIVSWAGVELELAVEATADVLELAEGPPTEATKDAGVFWSFLGLHSFTLGLGGGITFFFVLKQKIKKKAISVAVRSHSRKL